MDDPTPVAEGLDRRGSGVLVVHTHADLDAVGAAAGLARAVDGPTRIIAPDGLKPAARELTEALGTTVATPEAASVEDADYLIVLDAPSSARIAPVGVGAEQDLLLVDHHEPGDLADGATAAYVDTEAGATAALVADLIEEMDAGVDPDAGVALAAGLFDDTRGLAGASPAEIRRFCGLLDAAGDRVDVFASLLERERSFGRRVAASKAVVRATGYRADRTLVLSTDVGSHQTAAANALRGAGADVALVFSERDEQTWVVGRAEAGTVDLPESLFAPLVGAFDGDGGGHASAGVAKLDTTDTEAVREQALAHLESVLGHELSALT